MGEYILYVAGVGGHELLGSEGRSKEAASKMVPVIPISGIHATVESPPYRLDLATCF